MLEPKYDVQHQMNTKDHIFYYRTSQCHKYVNMHCDSAGAE